MNVGAPVVPGRREAPSGACYPRGVRRDRRKPKNTDRRVRVNRSGGGARDGTSAKLKAVGKKMGNSGLDDVLKAKGSQRDRIIEFILQRLENVKSIQNKELLEIKNVRQWFREVARGEEGFHLPDPTRWHVCAQLYRRAIEALCNGNMGQGVLLLEKAVEAERTAEESLPEQVRVKLTTPERVTAAMPDTAMSVGTAATCPTRALPQGIRLASDILSIMDKMEHGPPLPRRRRRGSWWDEEVEEEEEDEADG